MSDHDARRTAIRRIISGERIATQEALRARVAEEGFDGMQEAQSWWGIYGPPNMPADIVNFLNAKINEALVDEAFVELMARSGAVAMPVTPEKFRQLQIDTMALAADIAERTGVTTN